MPLLSSVKRVKQVCEVTAQLAAREPPPRRVIGNPVPDRDQVTVDADSEDVTDDYAAGAERLAIMGVEGADGVEVRRPPHC